MQYQQHKQKQQEQQHNLLHQLVLAQNIISKQDVTMRVCAQ
jgi:hypothetical protein